MAHLSLPMTGTLTLREAVHVTLLLFGYKLIFQYGQLLLFLPPWFTLTNI